MDGPEGSDCGYEANGGLFPLSDELQRTNHRDGRDGKLRVLYKAKKMILLPLKIGRRYGFDVSVWN